MSGRLILLGVVGRPHGVRGLVRVHSYTATPTDLAAYGPLVDELGRRWAVSWRGEGVAALADASGRTVADRTEAAKLTNTRLFIERERLPAAGDEEFYMSDLVGLRAEGPDGEALGTVTVVHDYGAGPSLEIAGAGGALLIPFNRVCVPQVDLPSGRLVVVRPHETVAEPEMAS